MYISFGIQDTLMSKGGFVFINILISTYFYVQIVTEYDSILISDI